MKKIIAICLLLSLTAACETQQKINYNSPYKDSVQAGKSFSIDVAGNSTIPDANENNLISIKKEVVSALVGSQVFTSVSQNPDYKVEIKLTDVKNVSGFARVALGVIAGRNIVQGNVIVKDGKGKTISSFQAEGESASHPFSGNSSFDDAARAFADQVAKGLMKKL